MSWTTNDIPDLSGKIAVVTGANGGLGLETSRALAAAGAHVVMAARNQVKAAAARDDSLAGLPDASLESSSSTWARSRARRRPLRRSSPPIRRSTSSSTTPG
ncbi:MAG: SDR family NAD(P)-dependent oxidoreductase [Ilumatobacter fluminis]